MILSRPHPSVLAMLGLACSTHRPCAPGSENSESKGASEGQEDPAPEAPDEEGQSEQTEAPTGPPADLSPEREAMRQALSSRDHSPPCVEIEALASEAPIDDYAWLIEHVLHPPWVGMRAARCVLEVHSVEASELIESWVVDPQLKGLGYLVLDSLDSLPQQQAWDLAQLAIEEGPDPEAARKRIAKSDNPLISELATAPPDAQPTAPEEP